MWITECTVHLDPTGCGWCCSKSKVRQETLHTMLLHPTPPKTPVQSMPRVFFNLSIFSLLRSLFLNCILPKKITSFHQWTIGHHPLIIVVQYTSGFVEKAWLLESLVLHHAKEKTSMMSMNISCIFERYTYITCKGSQAVAIVFSLPDVEKHILCME